MTGGGKSKVYLAGIGMMTPVGFDTNSTAKAVSAGISRLQESEYISKLGKPITMALIPEDGLPEITHKLNREEGTTLQMGIMLMSSDIALKQIPQCFTSPDDIPLFLSGPEALKGVASSVSSKFIDYIIMQTDAKIDKTNSRLSYLGRAGVIDSIDLAMRFLEQSDTDYVLVGGADSFQDDDRLKYLDDEDRLLSEEVMNGFPPGEAAAYLLLTSDLNKAQIYNSGVISLSEPGTAQEPGHMYSDEPYRGEGLSEAFNKALSGINGTVIDHIYSSMNGEQFWAKEYGVATFRHRKHFTDDLKLEHPAEFIGDTGAAAGAILIGLAMQDLVKNGRAATSLVYCSSDQSYRGAICVNYEKLPRGVQ